LPGVDRDALRGALSGIVGEGRVSTREADLRTYARDMWPRLLLAVREGAVAEHPPDAVVWPETAEEVAAIVRLARSRHVPVVPYGAGSGVCGGAMPLHGGITVDLKRMDRILDIDDRDLVVEAECGINGERLERALAAKGLTLGHFPSSIYCSTLGGWLAARSGGQMSTRYGKIEDMVLGVTAVTGRGDILTTGRHGRVQAGPDWTQLLVGSEGTLAVLTSGRLRVRRAPAARHFRGFSFARIPAGLEAIRRVLQRGLRPAVIRLYDEFDSWMALRPHDKAKEAHASGALPGLAPPASKKGLLRGLIGGALDRPRALNALVELGAQKLLRPGCLLIVGVEGAEPRARVEADVVFGELERAGGKDLGEGPGKDWFARRYSVSYNMSKVFESGAFVDTMEVASTWERLMDLYEGVRAALQRHAFVMAHFSHAYSEGCSIYFTFAGHAPTRHTAEAKYDALWRDGMLAATRAGGTISHHHGVGLLKGPYMAEEHRESMALLHALKQTLDPDGIMNPGKLGMSTWTAT
jgi:alkyldihydroxyacetonephosphate synthase